MRDIDNQIISDCEEADLTYIYLKRLALGFFREPEKAKLVLLYLEQKSNFSVFF